MDPTAWYPSPVLDILFGSIRAEGPSQSRGPLGFHDPGGLAAKSKISSSS